ncbi:hypothetical protein ABG768_023789, partial [Culter alburnus]
MPQQGHGAARIAQLRQKQGGAALHINTERVCLCMNVVRDDSDEKRRKRSCQEGKEEQMREKGK